MKVQINFDTDYAPEDAEPLERVLTALGRSVVTPAALPPNLASFGQVQILNPAAPTVAVAGAGAGVTTTQSVRTDADVQTHCATGPRIVNAPAPEKLAVPSEEETVEALRGLINRSGLPAAKALLESLGVPRATELHPSQRMEFIALANAGLGSEAE